MVLSDGVSLTINLAGAVGAGDYVLLERTDDTTVPSVTALLTYTGALANDGRTLTLTRNDGGVEDSVVGGTDWGTIGGNNDTKDTPQWTGTQWVTGTPTPGRENVSSGTTVANDEDDNTETTTTTSTSGTSNVSKSSSSGSSKKPPVPKAPPELALEITTPRTAYVNQEVELEVLPSGVGETIARSLTYTWNFGDTYTGEGKKPSHIFAYPGEYIVVVEGVFAKQRATARVEVTVLPVSFTLGTTPEGDVTIKNGAKYEVDLGGFTLSGTSAFTFPKYTIIRAGGTLTVPKSRIGGGQSVALYDTQKVLVTSYGSATISQPQTLAHVATVSKISEKETTPTIPKEQLTQEEEPKKETVIQIGNVTKEEPRGLARIFKNIFSFFGL